MTASSRARSRWHGKPPAGHAAVLLAVAVMAGGCVPAGPPQPGDRLPDSVLEVIDPTASPWSVGDRVSLSELEGRPVLIDFWASWCGPCREQHRHVSEVAERYGDRLVVLGVLVDDSPTNALRWMEDQGATYPTAIETEDALTDAFYIRASGMPHLALLDPDRRLMWHRLGASATGIPEEVLARVDSILGSSGS